MKKYYFTFGFGHKYEGCFVIIEAESREGARRRMVEKFGTEWAFCYNEKQWTLSNGKTQQEEFSLTEVKYLFS